MVLFNYSTKELTAKVVYYGPGLCGKTTNLQWIHEKVPIKNKGKMLSLATETDRTLFFDFLPIEIGTIRGMRTRIQLYTVPGQVFYATRRMVLKGADCIVFVCDTQEPMLEACLESYENMRQNLEANEIDPDEIPMVLQYNKRDLPNALPIEILNEKINLRSYPYYEAVAIKGIGVEETLKGVTKLVFKSLSARYGMGDAPAAPAPSPPALAAPVAPAPRPPAPQAKTATLPPAAGRKPVPSPEDVLDVNLEPAEARRRGDTAEIPLIVEEDEVPEPRARPAPPAPPTPQARPSEPPRPRLEPKGTLISNSDEVQDLRRRISLPSADFDVNLEAVEEEEDEIEEISLENDPLPPLRRPSRPEPPPPLAPPLPPASPLRDNTDPIAVTVARDSRPTEVSVPIELSIEPGATEVNLSLRLVLKIKRS